MNRPKPLDNDTPHLAGDGTDRHIYFNRKERRGWALVGLFSVVVPATLAGAVLPQAWGGEELTLSNAALGAFLAGFASLFVGAMAGVSCEGAYSEGFRHGAMEAWLVAKGREAAPPVIDETPPRLYGIDPLELQRGPR